MVTEVYKFAQEIGAATNEQSHGSSQIARATTRLNEITHEINSAVEEQASGAQAVVKAMERMRELVQQSHLGLDGTGRLGGTDVKDVARSARLHGPLRTGAARSEVPGASRNEHTAGNARHAAAAASMTFRGHP